MHVGTFRGFEVALHEHRHPDALEGMRAFREERAPRFNQDLPRSR